MASLTGNSINTTYQGLLKTEGNGTVGTSSTPITDGDGNKVGIELASNAGAYNVILKSDDTYTNGLAVDPTGVLFGGSVDFQTSSVDFTNATVIGLPGGAAGLVDGAGVDSMISDLTSVPATATGARNISIGHEAKAGGNDAVAMGPNADGRGDQAVAVGHNSVATTQNTVGIGNGAKANQTACVAIGLNAQATGTYGSNVAIGPNTQVTGSAHGGSVAIGVGTQANSHTSVAMGENAYANFQGTVAIGKSAKANATGSVALGSDVIADKADTVSMKALDLQTPSTPTAGGIIMTDAGSTERRINLDASGNLLIDSNPVGGLTSVSDTSIVNGSTTGADIIFHSTTVPAGTFTSGDIVSFRSLHKMEQSNGGWTYWSAWISNSTTLLSGWSLGGGAATSGIPNTVLYNKTFVIHDADGTGNGTDWFSDGYAVEQSEQAGRGAYADSIGRTGINWNLPVYINYQVYIDNTGNYNEHRGTTLTKINS